MCPQGSRRGTNLRGLKIAEVGKKLKPVTGGDVFYGDPLPNRGRYKWLSSRFKF